MTGSSPRSAGTPERWRIPGRQTGRGKTYAWSRVAREYKKTAPGEKMLVGLHDPRDVAPNAGEIAALHRTVNIHHAPDVVVRERFHFIAAVDGRHVGEYLWTNHSRSTDPSTIELRTAASASQGYSSRR